jgi:hypothetical protein
MLEEIRDINGKLPKSLGGLPVAFIWENPTGATKVILCHNCAYGCKDEELEADIIHDDVTVKCDQCQTFISKELEEMYKVKVMLVRDVERFPHFIARKGMTGVIEEITNGYARVKVDAELHGSEEWENCIIWNGEEDLVDFAKDVKLIAE